MQVSKDELEELMVTLQKVAQRKEGKGSALLHDDVQVRAVAHATVWKLFETIDVNNDGKISEKEFVEWFVTKSVGRKPPSSPSAQRSASGASGGAPGLSSSSSRTTRLAQLEAEDALRAVSFICFI